MSVYEMTLEEKVFDLFDDGKNNDDIVRELGVSIEEIEKLYEQYGEYKEMRNYIFAGGYSQALKIAKKYASKNIKFKRKLVYCYILVGAYRLACKIIKDKYKKDVRFRSLLVMSYLKQKKYDEAIEYAKECLDNPFIASQYVSCCIKTERYEDAISIIDKYPDNKVFQNQLFYVYFGMGEIDEALKIAALYPDEPRFKSAVSKLCKCYGIPFDIPESKEEIFKEECKVLSDVDVVLIGIRDKLSDGSISSDDITRLEGIKNKLDDNKYNLVLIAIYERLGMKSSALQLLKKMDDLDKKFKNQLSQRIKNKSKVYDIGIWDKLIGWSFIETMEPSNPTKTCYSEIKKTIYDRLDDRDKTLCFLVQEALVQSGNIEEYKRFQELLDASWDKEVIYINVVGKLHEYGGMLAEDRGINLDALIQEGMKRVLN